MNEILRLECTIHSVTEMLDHTMADIMSVSVMSTEEGRQPAGICTFKSQPGQQLRYDESHVDVEYNISDLSPGFRDAIHFVSYKGESPQARGRQGRVSYLKVIDRSRTGLVHASGDSFCKVTI